MITNLLDDGVGGHESGVGVGQLLDQLLVLVQLLQVLNGTEVDLVGLGDVAVLGVSCIRREVGC